MIGSRLGKWVLDKELGRGGMGRVFLAHEEPGERVGAVKVLAAELAQETGFVYRFQREIDALAQLDHPNIVHFFDSGHDNGHYYFSMEYVEGCTFDDLLHEHGRLPWADVLHVALQIAPALKHAHDRGVVHRDLKPANLMRAADGTVKLTDFGIAKVFAGQHLTSTGGIVGTAEFLSPEQAAGKPATKRSDLYSLGVVLYTLLTGRPPFLGESPVDLLHKHRYAQFDRPAKLVSGIPYEIDEVVCQLLEKEPSKRPADGLVLHKQLDVIRRKLERKVQQTASDPLLSMPTRADNALLDEPSEQPGPATLMSRLMRVELKRMNQGGVITQWFNQPWVLVTLFLLCVAGIVWGFWIKPRVRLGETAEEPRAMSLGEEQIAQRLALSGLKDRGPVSEAQRFYQRGLQACKQGDTETARRLWRGVVQAFKGVESEERWVKLAEEGATEMEKRLPAEEAAHATARKALERARQLAARGERREAEAVWQGLEALYSDEPAGQVMQELRRDRGR